MDSRIIRRSLNPAVLENALKDMAGDSCQELLNQLAKLIGGTSINQEDWIHELDALFQHRKSPIFHSQPLLTSITPELFHSTHSAAAAAHQRDNDLSIFDKAQQNGISHFISSYLRNPLTLSLSNYRCLVDFLHWRSTYPTLEIYHISLSER